MTETPERPATMPESFAECWPPRDTVAKLVEAVTHLLDAHDCDTDGYEQFKSARDVAATWLASSLGEPVSQEAPSVEAIDADDVSDLLQFIHDNAYDAKESRRFRNLVADLERIAKRASRSAFSGIPRTENEPPSACECLDATHPEFCHSGPAHRGWCDMYAMATDPARASVISSASPLSEEDRAIVRTVRELARTGRTYRWEAPLLAIIDRLSASAPSPEDDIVGGRPGPNSPTPVVDLMAALKESLAHLSNAPAAVTEGRDPGGEA